jgi:glycosyltransferase involved in cell wall biosynthesis
LNVQQGSGTFAGIACLMSSLRKLGAEVILITPTFRLPNYTLQRLAFNECLARRIPRDCDVTVGFDMDGYKIAGRGNRVHVAAIKGVIADELRFEAGLTRATMRLQAACEQRHVERAQAVITTSEYSAGRMRELYGFRGEVRIVPEMIDLRSWEELLAANPAKPAGQKFRVLSVGRFYPRKRLDALLQAAAMLRGRIPALELRMVGGGPEEAKLKALCRQLGLESAVMWLKDIPRGELAREYNGCDIFCLPSVQEGFGIVFLEAMASGRAIVAARASAVPEVVRHGILVKPESVEALADGIEQLFRQNDLRQELVLQGQEVVKKFDASIVGARFLEELRRLLGRC